MGELNGVVTALWPQTSAMRAWKPGSMVSIASRPEVPHITSTFSRCSCAMVTTTPPLPPPSL